MDPVLAEVLGRLEGREAALNPILVNYTIKTAETSDWMRINKTLDRSGGNVTSGYSESGSQYAMKFDKEKSYRKSIVYLNIYILT